MSEMHQEKWEDVAAFVSTKGDLGEHAAAEAETTQHALREFKKALRLTVPEPLTSLWLGKVEKAEHSEKETFEGLRGYSSKDLAMLAAKDLTVGAQQRIFVDAAKVALLLAGSGPKLDPSSPKAAEEVNESVEQALQVVERVANGVEDIGLAAAKLALLVTGAPFPAHGPVGIAKAVLWGLNVANWGGGFFGGSVFKLKEWAEQAKAHGAPEGEREGGEGGHAEPKAPAAPPHAGAEASGGGGHAPGAEEKSEEGEAEEGPEGLLGLISTNELLQAAKRKALIFAGEGFGAYAGRSAEMAGGFSAEVIGGVFAEVLAGGVAELKGGLSAEVIGGLEAALKSNWGHAEVLGKGIEIGARVSQFMQRETEHVALSATSLIELGVGPATGLQSPVMLHGPELHVVAGNTQIDSDLTVTRDEARLEVKPGSIVAAAAPLTGLKAQRQATSAARTAFDAAWEAAGQLGDPTAVNAARAVARDAWVASRNAASRAFQVALAVADPLKNGPKLRVEAKGVRIETPLASVEVFQNGTVKVSQQPDTSIELSGGAIKIKAPLGLSVESGPNKWTFGPAGARGPGMAGN